MPGSNGGSPLTDVRELRERARRHIERGAITEGYRADREKVVQLLNEALATELVCALRYRRHYHAASGVSGEKAKEEFLEHAVQEEQHADMLATRITELGGLPDYSPDTLTSRAHSEYVEGVTLADMLKEDLIAERIAIDSYSEMIRFLGDEDITSRRVLEEILAVEEEHANDLTSLLHNLGGD
jgi:bacterioferritin